MATTNSCQHSSLHAGALHFIVHYDPQVRSTTRVSHTVTMVANAANASHQSASAHGRVRAVWTMDFDDLRPLHLGE